MSTNIKKSRMKPTVIPSTEEVRKTLDKWAADDMYGGIVFENLGTGDRIIMEIGGRESYGSIPGYTAEERAKDDESIYNRRTTLPFVNQPDVSWAGALFVGKARTADALMALYLSDPLAGSETAEKDSTVSPESNG